MKNLGLLREIAIILLIVGGINIGLEGLFNFNLIGAILGVFLSRLFFIVVGVAAGFLIYTKYVKKDLIP
ncbi:MAG: DUF378 domain-containing protein [Gammaproteobacteria bacterium]|nr:DUF378 domain-containing protein [Gammaproteobacteria bacterium]